MTAGEQLPAVTDNSSFETLLDNAFERLRDRQVQYSIKKIGELETALLELEADLDRFLLEKNKEGPAG
ncbi:MAG: hypothetical protein LBP23_05225 [Treponema sp.]|jgi:hypothetical protein|nr:hypothetical protein [Treponema sp.]